MHDAAAPRPAVATAGGSTPATAPATPDWATHRRRRWSAARVAAALLLHLLALTALTLAVDRVERPHGGQDRSTTLVFVALARPAPRPPSPPAAPSRRARATPALARTGPAGRPTPQRGPPGPTGNAIALPAVAAPAQEPPTPAVAFAARPPASAPSSVESILDSAATRLAIREAARHPLLSERTAEATGMAPPPGANARLAQGLAAAQKGDCAKGEFMGAGGGLISLPFLIAAQALGKCSSK